MPDPTDRARVTLPQLQAKAARGEPITWLTCYDFPTAYLQEQAGIEMILVGDSLGMTMLGYDSTLPVKMDDMIRHAAAVRRGGAAREDDAHGRRARRGPPRPRLSPPAVTGAAARRQTAARSRAACHSR